NGPGEPPPGVPRRRAGLTIQATGPRCPIPRRRREFPPVSTAILGADTHARPTPQEVSRARVFLPCPSALRSQTGVNRATAGTDRGNTMISEHSVFSSSLDTSETTGTTPNPTAAQKGIHAPRWADWVRTGDRLAASLNPDL